MNRKGGWETRYSLIFPVAGVIITIIVLVFAFGLANYKNKLTEIPPKLKAETIALRFYNNPDCFAYVDEGTVYPGVIDPQKFTKKNLDTCYTTKQKTGIKVMNFRLKLGNQEIITNNYFYKDDFILAQEVLVKTDAGLKRDILQIYVQERIGA